MFMRFMKVLYLQVYPRVSKMASVSEPEVQSCEDHRGHGQREQDDSVQEHRGECWLTVDKLHTHTSPDSIQ